MKVLTGLLAMGLFTSSAQANVSFNLAARVAANCGISKVTSSNGRNATIVVHSSCNAESFWLAFANSPVGSPIETVQGNAAEAVVQGSSVLIRPRAPGNQVTVIHLVRDVSAESMGAVGIEAY